MPNGIRLPSHCFSLGHGVEEHLIGKLILLHNLVIDFFYGAGTSKGLESCNNGSISSS